MTFRIACLAVAAVFAAHAFLLSAAVRKWPELWRTLPRHRGLGALLAGAALVWAAFEAMPLLEGDLARFQPLLWIAVPVAAVLGWLFLEFLPVRALAGLLLLALPLLLQEAFVRHLQARPVFAAGCYLAGLGAMLLVATPWRYRDLLRRCGEVPAWRGRGATVAAAGAAALFFAVFACL